MILATKLHKRILRLKSTSSVYPEEGQRLTFLAAQVPEGGVIVELGSCWGRSACYLGSGLKHAGRRATIYCVDLWDLGVTTPERHRTPDVFERFRNNLTYCGLWEYVAPIKSDTVTAATAWMRPVDLLFIDAGHKYHEVLGDYQAWSPFVKPGGVIAFHDYLPGPQADVVRCIEEDVLPSGRWEFLALHRRLWTARRKMDAVESERRLRPTTKGVSYVPRSCLSRHRVY